LPTGIGIVIVIVIGSDQYQQQPESTVARICSDQNQPRPSAPSGIRAGPSWQRTANGTRPAEGLALVVLVPATDDAGT